MKEFDEYEAIKVMRESLPEEAQSLYDDDQLLNLIDVIWDFYEQNGMLDIDLVDDDSAEDDNMLTELIDYAQRMIKKDRRATISLEHIPSLVEAEIKYEDSILDGEI